jgi:adenosylmethionine-8-amino-7-oxononanoate aminotransferase
MSSVFYRSPHPLEALRAEGCYITDIHGNRFLDAAGGAIVNGIGHGRSEIGSVIAGQIQRVDFVHASVFTTPALEDYCSTIATLVPLENARVYPVSGGSEATETALKMARAYQLSRGREERRLVLSRQDSYHGNTLGALDLSGRPALRQPYEPWLGRFVQLPDDLDSWEQAISAGEVAAVVLEPISGAARAAEVPLDDFWPAITELCRHHDVLLVADEVMSGFGRTGTWFGVERWGVSPDLMICGKGASSGYWPLGLTIASQSVFEAISSTFVHGFTFSHHAVGAAVGRAVVDIITNEGLVDAAATKGKGLRSALADALPGAEIRGAGLLIGVVWDAGPGTKEVVEAARRQGLLVYPSALDSGIVLGPPLIISDAEIDDLVTRLASAVGGIPNPGL